MAKSFTVWLLLIGVCCVSCQVYKDYLVNINAVSPAAGSQAKGAVVESMGASRIKVISPVHSFVRAQCTFTVRAGQAVIVSRSGETDLTKDGIRYAASGTINVLSIGNELVIAGNAFSCTFTAVRPDNTNCDCGWRKTARIVGGTYTTANEFVSHVGLIEFMMTRAEMVCGGTIISPKHVVSAAHCSAAIMNLNNLRIFAGYHDFTRAPSADTPWSSQYAVAGWRNHPSFNPNTGENDIAIVHVAGYIRFTLGVGPACIPFTYNKFNFEGKKLTAVGWGMTSFAGSLSNILKKVDITVEKQTTCAARMPNITPANICTFTRGSDTCQNDSGGGLYFDVNQTFKFFIAVINSGVACGGNYPSVNTRIDYYFGFIVDNTPGVHLCRK